MSDRAHNQIYLIHNVWLRAEIKIMVPSQRLLYHNDDAAFRKRSWSFFSNATPANYTTTILITGQNIELMGHIFKHSSLPIQTCLLPVEFVFCHTHVNYFWNHYRHVLNLWVKMNRGARKVILCSVESDGKEVNAKYKLFLFWILADSTGW